MSGVMRGDAILNLDRDESRRAMVSESLEREGFSIVQAATASEALQALLSNQIRLILINSDLPDPGAEEFGRKLKSDTSTSSIPLLRLSYAEQTILTDEKLSSADLYLNCPADIEILTAIKMFLRIRDAEEGLRNNESCLRALSEAGQEEQQRGQAAPHTVRLWISHDDASSLSKRQWLELTNLKPGDEMEWEGGIHPEDYERCVEIYGNAVKKAAGFEMEYRHREGDGPYRWLRDEGMPSRLSKGRLTGYVGSCVDITDRKQIEAERDNLREQERAAIEDSETAWLAKDEFVNDLAPELSGPLEAILSWARLLKSTPVDQATMDEALETIENSARTQSRLIKDRLDAARLDRSSIRFDWKPVDLSIVIEAALENIQPAAEARGIALYLSPESSPGIVAGDANRLQQVVWILLTNAVKYNRPGGKVDVLLERTEDHASIVITDTGRGIRPEDLPSIFDRFYRGDGATESYKQSSCRELLLARTLVELHGGTIQANSPGEDLGAQFTVILPLASASASSIGTAVHSDDRKQSEVAPSDERGDMVSA